VNQRSRAGKKVNRVKSAPTPASLAWKRPAAPTRVLASQMSHREVSLCTVILLAIAARALAESQQEGPYKHTPYTHKDRQRAACAKGDVDRLSKQANQARANHPTRRTHHPTRRTHHLNRHTQAIKLGSKPSNQANISSNKARKPSNQASKSSSREGKGNH
jgi:hypothetical protein